MYNDPFLFVSNSKILYFIVAAFFQAIFLSSILLFWLTLLHSVTIQDEIIDKKRFYKPKLLLSTCFFIYLFVERSYLPIKRHEEPYIYFTTLYYTDSMLFAIRLVSVFLVFTYFIYYAVLTKPVV